MKGLESRPRRRERETPLPLWAYHHGRSSRHGVAKRDPIPRTRDDMTPQKRRPICHAVAFSSLFACRNLVFSSILRAILHTTDIDQRPAIACGGRKTRPHRTARPLLIHATASPPKRPRRQDQQGRLAHNTIFYHVFSRRYSSTPWHFTPPSNPPADRRNFAHTQLRLHPRPNLGCCTSTGAPSSPAGTTPKGRGPRSPRS